MALGFTEDEAYKRIHAARVARKHPAIFGAVAEGRLNLTGILLLAPHLTGGNAAEQVGCKRRREPIARG